MNDYTIDYDKEANDLNVSLETYIYKDKLHSIATYEAKKYRKEGLTINYYLKNDSNRKWAVARFEPELCVSIYGETKVALDKIKSNGKFCGKLFGDWFFQSPKKSRSKLITIYSDRNGFHLLERFKNKEPRTFSLIRDNENENIFMIKGEQRFLKRTNEGGDLRLYTEEGEFLEVYPHILF